MKQPRELGVGLLGVILLLGAGCSVAGVDKAGSQRPVVLTMANPASLPDELMAFVSEVAELSSGTIRIDVHSGWRMGEVDFEKGLINDVKEGKTDLGAAGSRAFDSVGVLSLRALHAPLLITSYTAEEKVMSDSPLIAEMLDGLEPIGLTGLGVLPGPLRHPLGIGTPLVGPEDYVGRTIGVNKSRVAEETMRALGAHPVGIAVSGDVAAFGGIEQQIASIAGNQYDKVGKYLTANVAFWPRPFVLFSSDDALDRLPGEQQQVLRQAAAQSIAASMKTLRSDEAEGLGNLCRRGVTLLTANATELAAMHRAVQPVYDTLNQDAGTREFIAAISDQVRAVSPEPPPSCEPGGQPSGQAGARSVLDGVWMVTTKFGDYPDPNPLAENYGDAVHVFDRGHFAFTQEYQNACTWGYGTYVIKGDQMEWTFIDGGGIAPNNAQNKPGEFFVWTWSLYRDTLTLTGSGIPLALDKAQLKPWHRISREPSARYLNQKCPPPPNASG
jgi:TRAP-type C4-dicarboxylate transport system substrate-binding protein